VAPVAMAGVAAVQWHLAAVMLPEEPEAKALSSLSGLRAIDGLPRMPLLA